MSTELRNSALIDASGTRHRPADGEVRIVSLVPSITELLFDLHLGPCVVGRTTFCVHPAHQTRHVRPVGGTKTVKLDAMRELKPSHVVVNVDENAREAVRALQSFVPHIIVTHPIEPLDNLTLYRLLGGVFRKTREAERLCQAFESAYEELLEASKTLPSRRVLYLIWRKPWMTVSKRTYISRILALLNWQTVGGHSATRYPEVKLSDGFLRDVDIILFSTEPYPFKQTHIDEFCASFSCFGKAAALIDAEMTSWYGSRAIKGLKYLKSFAPTLIDPTPP